MGARVYLLVTFVLLLAAGCDSGTSTSASSPRWSAAELGASFVQFRSDEGTLHAAISVTNHTRHSIYVTGVALRWSGVREEHPTRQDNAVTPGTTVSFFIDLKGLRCDQGQEPPHALVVASGRSGVLRLDEVGTGLLRDLWRRVCDDRAIRDAAIVSFGQAWQPAGSMPSAGLRGSLLVTRRSARTTVTITSFRGSVLLDLVPVNHGTPLGVLRPGQGTLTIPVIIRSDRLCTEHALSQATQTFLLRVAVTAGRTSTLLIVSPDLAAQNKINRNVAASCKIQNHGASTR